MRLTILKLMKKKKKQNKNKKGLIYKIFYSCFKRKYKNLQILNLENIPTEASIIVGNHSKIHGPVLAETKFPHNKKTWCIGNMIHLKECPNYIFQDFWSRKPKWTHWFYRFLSIILAPLFVHIFKNADIIPVYKDTRGISTFKTSVKELKNNNHIIIFPEEHKPFNNILNDFQTKFIDIAKLYFKDTGKELSFIPMYNAPTIKTVIYGKPIKFDSSDKIENQRKIICNYLKKEITELAKSLPTHTVIPYENIRKKFYPKSK